ncbi:MULTISPECIES: DUF4199 domain-containing protein [Rufibacter]|uniref:DUF4199 domain-containing protein n=1 Tax=Rufibacter quisquiliarum TaxID=1549639 RepID=A0A839GN31_9BACT|nr:MULTISPECIES: DUF4199 domain-containing protein [Rufibacter]MBA9079323.1 hypothetical protein [Rufibacter quisquiliarum]
MFDRAVVNTAIRYGVTGGVVGVVYVVSLALLGLENPYANVAEVSSIVFFIPVFIILATKYYKKYYGAEIGFAKAFKVGLATTFFLAFTTAVLLCIFSLLAGEEMIQQYIILEQENMRLHQKELIQMMGEPNYKFAFEKLKELNATTLAQRTFMFRMLAGFLTSIVSSVFFRK